MTKNYSEKEKIAQEYYNSDDADNFYFHVWGGEDIHIGLYKNEQESIADASQRTDATMASQYSSTPDANTKIIDLGAAYGGAARWLVKEFGCDVTCLNLSEAQNARNRSITAEQNLSDKITVIDGSFEEVPLEDNSFDLAWCQDSVLHSSKRDVVFKEIDRILKPGGEFVFTDPMQADDCPEGVLQPVLDRIHLSSLGSFKFYRDTAKQLGWEELDIQDHTHQLVTHYTRVRQELMNRREELAGVVSEEYVERMIKGLGHWIDAGHNGYLAWGIMHFRKPT